MNLHCLTITPTLALMVSSAIPTMAQTPPTNTHYAALTILMTPDSQQNPKAFSFSHASSVYGQAPIRNVTVAEPGYALEYLTESGGKICSPFHLGQSPYDGSIAPGFTASVPTQENGTGYHIYKDGILLWTENIVSPTDNLSISVQNLGTGKLRILPASVNNFYLSLDGGLHWEIAYRPELTTDWVYQISKYDPLKVPKPLVRIDVWHKLRRQTFTYEVGATPTPLTK